MSKRSNPRKKEYLKSIADFQNFSISTDEEISFNFRYYRFGEEGGESFEEWEKEQILADLNTKLKHFSEKKKKELIMDRTLELYSRYPFESNFKMPSDLSGYHIRWARLRVTGKRRLIGFFAEPGLEEKEQNTFYIVFLDKDHRFAPSRKD